MVDQVTNSANLVLVKGDDAPAIIQLKKKEVVVGRGNSSDITLSSLQISRRHATFEYLNRKWFIRDASTNGLFVGTNRLQKGVVHELHHGDLIHMIPTEVLTYRFEYILREEEEKTEAEEPELLSLHDDDSSNHSESLLSVDHDIELWNDLPPCSAPVSTENENLLGKRKSVLEGVDKNKRHKRSDDNDGDDDEEDELEISQSLLGNEASQLLATEEELNITSIETCSNIKLLQSKCLSLYRKFKLSESENQTLRVEKTFEREEYLKRQNDAKNETEAHKEELYKKVVESLEQELSCCICNEVFIQPTVVECGHTFCNYCICEWVKKKPECPICRKFLRNVTKHIEMDNFLVKIHSMMSDEIRNKRDQQILEREQTKAQAAANSNKTDNNNRRRNGVPNEFFQFPPERIPIPFDLLAELQSINDWGVVAPPPAHNNNAVASAANQRRSARLQRREPGSGSGAGPRRRRINNRWLEQANLPGGNPDYANTFLPQPPQLQPLPPPQNPGMYGGMIPTAFRGATVRGSFFPAMFPFGGGNGVDNNLTLPPQLPNSSRVPNIVDIQQID